MKDRPRPEEQDDLLRPRLIDMVDRRHELVKLAALIDWEVFEREGATRSNRAVRLSPCHLFAQQPWSPAA
jgi:hypothetical protein